ncbi:hypothetical protein U9M48_027049 [Paspalum notatum var. saurae]|uniref:Uncharacterized protein n=1 Tax=Paspalum notatum var. saurae TaxID=547442 RepID=A0AAQ3TXZ4_PASNO
MAPYAWPLPIRLLLVLLVLLLLLASRSLGVGAGIILHGPSPSCGSKGNYAASELLCGHA